MTVKEILYKKYCARLKDMNRAAWKDVELTAQGTKQHPAQGRTFNVSAQKNFNVEAVRRRAFGLIVHNHVNHCL